MNNKKNDQSKRIKAINSLEFLRNHPAISPDILGDSHFDGLWFHMAKCCKRGLSEGSKKFTTIYKGDKGWKRFKDRFEKEYKDDKETTSSLQSVEVTYKEKFGEPWVFDHVEYWYETTFFIFEGNPYADVGEHMDYKNWGRYAGPEGGANTYEDMLIRCARNVKRAFGSFDINKDFYTPEEKKNNKENRSFLTSQIEGRKGYSLSSNPNYVSVENGLVNLRWLKWFIETDYCKKNWDCNIKDFKKTVAKLDKIPKKRVAKLEK